MDKFEFIFFFLFFVDRKPHIFHLWFVYSIYEIVAKFEIHLGAYELLWCKTHVTQFSFMVKTCWAHLNIKIHSLSIESCKIFVYLDWAKFSIFLSNSRNSLLSISELLRFGCIFQNLLLTNLTINKVVLINGIMWSLELLSWTL